MNHRKLFVAVAAVAALGVAASAAVAQTASQKALVDQAKAAGAVGEQADGFLGIRTTVAPDTQAAVSATNAGRRQAYARSAADAGTTAEVAGAFLQVPGYHKVRSYLQSAIDRTLIGEIKPDAALREATAKSNIEIQRLSRRRG